MKGCLRCLLITDKPEESVAPHANDVAKLAGGMSLCLDNIRLRRSFSISFGCPFSRSGIALAVTTFSTLGEQESKGHIAEGNVSVASRYDTPQDDHDGSDMSSIYSASNIGSNNLDNDQAFRNTTFLAEM